MQDLGTLSAPYNAMSVADGINDNGQVVGSSYSSIGGYASYAFLFSGGSMQNIGTLPVKTASVATAINNARADRGRGQYRTATPRTPSLKAAARCRTSVLEKHFPSTTSDKS